MVESLPPYSNSLYTSTRYYSQGLTLTYTREILAERLGKPLTLITDDVVSFINALEIDDPDTASLLTDTLFTYSHVITNTNYSVRQYLDAVRFVSYLLMNMTNYDSYRLTYPDRYERLMEKHKNLSELDCKKRISSHVHAVSKGRLVTTLLSQVQIPTKLLNLGLLQEAINTEADLMRTSRSDMVREKAASTLIQYLGTEDTQKIELSIGFSKSSVIEDYEKALLKFSSDQKLLMEKGHDILKVTNVKITDVEVVE